MPKVKRRMVRPKEPTVFSVRLTRENLRRLNSLHDELGLNNRNMTLNFVIENYHSYQIYSDLIQALKQIFREEIRARIAKG